MHNGVDSVKANRGTGCEPSEQAVAAGPPQHFARAFAPMLLVHDEQPHEPVLVAVPDNSAAARETPVDLE
ncbi:MAG: hypothetical protein ACKON9_09510 [Planctomycetaceae bacterium]